MISDKNEQIFKNYNMLQNDILKTP